MESFIDEMKRYLGFTEEDAACCARLGPRLEKYFPEMAERFLFPNPFSSECVSRFYGRGNANRAPEANLASVGARACSAASTIKPTPRSATRLATGMCASGSNKNM